MIIFLVAVFLAFATGTSWGTFSILIPIVCHAFPEGEMLVISIAACLSGAVCGIAGLLLVGGTDHTITTTTADNRGFTAIMVSWLAKFSPAYMILTSFLLVFLQKGADEISTVFMLDQSFSEIITGIILFFIIGSEFFINYELKFRRNRKEAA